jgi:hypothetical protein
MEQKKFEKILNILYPDIKIVSYGLWDKFTMNDDGEFTKPINPTIFVEVMGESKSGLDMSDDLSRITGFDIIVDKI